MSAVRQPGAEFKLSRRRFGAWILALVGTPALAQAPQEVVRELDKLAPGEFTWHPERQPSGPVSVIVSIPQQTVHVYRNGVRIGVSTCSTGKRGHETPRGVFVVLQKDKHHFSSTYNNAPMPNMNRLTWSGIALHAGNLPGYPASHGCVRLPLEFSAHLFEITELGTPVIIADEPEDPWDLTHPGLVLPAFSSATMAGAIAESGLDARQWHDADLHPVSSILASSADREILLVQNGEVVQRSPLRIADGSKIGTNVLVLRGLNDPTGAAWSALVHDRTLWDAGKPDDQVLYRLSTSSDFTSAMASVMHPGLVVVTTDLPLHPDTRTGQDFVIMTNNRLPPPLPKIRPADL